VGRAPFPHLVALLCGFLAAAAIGCGSDNSNLIPSQRASDLTGRLDAIKTAIDDGSCDGLSAKVAQFKADAASLPPNVDRRLRSRINDGAASLQQHAVDDCLAAAQAKTQTQTTTTTTETTPTTTTTTSTTPTTTTPTTTTPATTTPTTTTPPTTTTAPPSDTTTAPDGGTGDGGGTGGTPGEVPTP
jgi:hypothetical protein